MSEKFLKIFLSDFLAVRVICNACKTVFEVSAAALGPTFHSGLCPKCQQPLFLPNPRQPNPLVQLSAALTALEASQTVTIEFPVKAP